MLLIVFLMRDLNTNCFLIKLNRVNKKIKKSLIKLIKNKLIKIYNKYLKMIKMKINKKYLKISMIIMLIGTLFLNIIKIVN